MRVLTKRTRTLVLPGVSIAALALYAVPFADISALASEGGGNGNGNHGDDGHGKKCGHEKYEDNGKKCGNDDKGDKGKGKKH